MGSRGSLLRYGSSRDRRRGRATGPACFERTERAAGACPARAGNRVARGRVLRRGEDRLRTRVLRARRGGRLAAGRRRDLVSLLRRHPPVAGPADRRHPRQRLQHDARCLGSRAEAGNLLEVVVAVLLLHRLVRSDRRWPAFAASRACSSHCRRGGDQRRSAPSHSCSAACSPRIHSRRSGAPGGSATSRAAWWWCHWRSPGGLRGRWP